MMTFEDNEPMTSERVINFWVAEYLIKENAYPT